MEPHDVKIKHENLPGYHPGGKNIQQIKRHEAQIPIPRQKAGYHETLGHQFPEIGAAYTIPNLFYHSLSECQAQMHKFVFWINTVSTKLNKAKPLTKDSSPCYYI